MSMTVTLDEEHFKLVSEVSRAAGMTREQYIQALIDADQRSFDEILRPAREGFESMSDGEVDALMERARAAARRTK
jgi:hypothetical protein